MIVRRRGFMSGSPPPARAATVNSLMRRVKILPRLASRAPFLCLIDAHLEWPDMAKTPWKTARNGLRILSHAARQDDPDVRAIVPRTPAIIAQHGLDRETRARQLTLHIVDRDRAKDQRESFLREPAAAPLHVALVERRQAAGAIVTHRFDQRDLRATRSTAERD